MADPGRTDELLENDALIERLRLIEDQPLAERAAAFAQLHDELKQALEHDVSRG